MIDYSQLDQPSLLRFIFYPRRDVTPCPSGAFDLFVPVAEGVSVACRFFLGDDRGPWILFFHGNGEVIGDYDGVASFYHQKHLNLAVADYRGYGASTGIPTLMDVLRDSHIILKEAVRELSRRRLRRDLWVMGRSLGSLSALELAYHHPDTLKGLIIESGFPSVVRILFHLGMPEQERGLQNLDQASLEQIQKISLPALIIHGERDRLVPMQNAMDLYDHLGTKEKELLIIPGATHNDIMLVGLDQYFDSLDRFIRKTDQTGAGRDP